MARKSAPVVRRTSPEGGLTITPAASGAGPTPATSGAGTPPSAGGGGFGGGGGAAGEGSDGASSSGGVYRYFYIGGTANAYPGSTVTMARRYKASTATLIGYSEFIDASTPPKKYRRMELAGNVSGCTWTGTMPDTCTHNPVYTANAVYAGSYIFPVNGAATINTLYRDDRLNSPPRSSACGSPNLPVVRIDKTTPGGSWDNMYPQLDYGDVPSPAWDGGTGNVYYSYPGIRTQYVSKTALNWAWSDTCIRNINTPNFGTDWGTAWGTLQQAIYDEDTDADAIARMLAATSWTGFANFPSNQLSTYTGATWDQRTAFTFAYSEIELRLTITGFPPSINFSVVAAFATMENDTLQVWSTDYATVDSTTDGSGGAVVTIPCAAQRAGTTRFIYALNYIKR